VCAPRARFARSIFTQRRWPRRSDGERTILRFRERARTMDATRDKCGTTTTNAALSLLLLLLLRTVHAPSGHRARVRKEQCSRLRIVPAYICVSTRLGISRHGPLGCSVPTAGDGELGRAALPRDDQSRRRIHCGGFPRRRATSLPRDAALSQSWQARRRTDSIRESTISPERHPAPSPPPPTPLLLLLPHYRQRERVVVVLFATLVS